MSDKARTDLDVKTMDLRQQLTSVKNMLESQISHNSQNITEMSEKINNYISNRLEEFSSKISKSFNETMLLQKQLKEQGEDISDNTKKLHKTQIYVNELVGHLGIRFNEMNELEIAIQDDSKGETNAYLTNRAQIKALHMELKNMSNKLPHYASHVITSHEPSYEPSSS